MYPPAEQVAVLTRRVAELEHLRELATHTIRDRDDRIRELEDALHKIADTRTDPRVKEDLALAALVVLT